MELLHAMRDLGIADPAGDLEAERALRRAVTREIQSATAVSRPPGQVPKPRAGWPWRRLGTGLVVGSLALGAAAVVLVSRDAPRAITQVGPSQTREGSKAVGMTETAYVVRRMRAAIARHDHLGFILSTVDTIGRPTTHATIYLDPRTSAFYQDDRAYDRDGHELYENYQVATPTHGHMRFQVVSVDERARTWSRGTSLDAEPIPRPSRRRRPLPPGAMSTPSMITRALSAHVAHMAGRSTINGVEVYVISSRAGEDHIRLYVDAQTFEPVREVERIGGAFGGSQITQVSKATSSTLAQITRPPRIPAGFRRVR